ncbi:MAG: hypothetical protein CMJ38_03510 [Phycisphaerae bacterium]|nr:hypothetical protein [Phycisphaerae bacterium]
MIRFVSQAIKNYHATGAIAPSSRFLAGEMVASIQQGEHKRILEVGCGTGAFTKAILNTLQSGDEFHIVEMNETFCEDIETNMLASFRENNPDITLKLHNELLQEAELEGEFDAIICGLPFNNFPVELVEELFQTMLALLKEGSELAYFEYLGMRTIKAIFGTPTLRKATEERTADINARMREFQGSENSVWCNLPPCRVVRLQK